MTNAAEILKSAHDAVGGARAQTHGDKGLNFETTATLHNAFDAAEARVRQAGRPGITDAERFALRMVLAKMSRILSGDHNLDDYVDMAGYAGCAGELAEAEQARKQRLKSDRGLGVPVRTSGGVSP